MLEITRLEDTSCREHSERNHRYDIRVHLEETLTDPQNNSKRKCHPDNIFLERSSLCRLSLNVEFDCLSLEREHLCQDKPRSKQKNQDKRYHSEHPANKCDVITSFLKRTKSDGIRRGSNWGTHTAYICRDRNSKCKRYSSTSISRQCKKDRCKECEHHCSSCSVTHEHREYTDHQKNTQKNSFRILSERLKHYLGKLNIKADLCRCKREDETAQEEHDDRIRESGHDILIVCKRTYVFLIHQETESLI